jgi:hypothetical protein
VYLLRHKIILTRQIQNEFSSMPLSFGAFGKAVAILVVAAFVLWLIFTYMFASEEAALDAEQVGALPVTQLTAKG